MTYACRQDNSHPMTPNLWVVGISSGQCMHWVAHRRWQAQSKGCGTSPRAILSGRKGLSTVRRHTELHQTQTVFLLQTAEGTFHMLALSRPYTALLFSVHGNALQTRFWTIVVSICMTRPPKASMKMLSRISGGMRKKGLLLVAVRADATRNSSDGVAVRGLR